VPDTEFGEGIGESGGTRDLTTAFNAELGFVVQGRGNRGGVLIIMDDSAHVSGN